MTRSALLLAAAMIGGCATGERLEPETYIASGNLIFEWEGTEQEVRSRLERVAGKHHSQRGHTCRT